MAISEITATEAVRSFSELLNGIRAALERKGETVGAHDLIIAATAISLDYTVFTANVRDFEKIEGLRHEKRAR